jgi:uncharacterized protein YjbI with pentapeptide repeats
MATPAFAIVRPRVFSPQTGEVLLLEDVVSTHLAAFDRGVVEIVGGHLIGKTTAIEYLDQVFAAEKDLRLADPHARLLHCLAPSASITVSTVTPNNNKTSLGRYQLATWGQDEWIEYLLAAHKSRCSSVMSRLIATKQFGMLGGNPCLWRLALDELAADETIPSATAALRRVVQRQFSTCSERNALRNFSLVAAAPLVDELDIETRAIAKCVIERPILRLLALDSVRTILAAEALMFHLRDGGRLWHLQRRLPSSLIQEVSLAVKAEEAVQSNLHRVLLGDDISLHAMAASLLHAADIGWQPTLFEATDDLRFPDLSHAYLPDARWPGIDLRNARLTGANLAGASLQNSDLEGAQVDSANLCGATLHGASLAKLNGFRTNFSQADLSFVRAPHANLQSDLTDANLEGALLTDASFFEAKLAGACFVRANLCRALLTRADITNADFTQANLQGSNLRGLDLRLACFDFAIFSRANLQECNLEGLELSGADFEGADLRGALLTSSTICRASFRGADLRDAGLADVEWEGVDLRGADLRGASFHLGSTRCGLVGSPYPSHGTRTGFYTDDYNEQDFKSPEEIRKANLCGADLRGANIEGVDFYLVDVRDARYDHQQMEHLRQCGAILKARAV